jgi:hypothetical protein
MQSVLEMTMCVLTVGKDSLLRLAWKNERYRERLDDIIYRLQDVISDVNQLERQVSRDKHKERQSET